MSVTNPLPYLKARECSIDTGSILLSYLGAGISVMCGIGSGLAFMLPFGAFLSFSKGICGPLQWSTRSRLM